MPGPILITPVEPFADAGLLDPLARHVERLFRRGTRLAALPLRLDAARDPIREQFNSSDLLLQILDHAPADAGRVLAVADVDLFVPILTFLFGEAQLDGPAAVVSTFRLHDELYGKEADPALLLERLLKEGIHELGHTFGLVHCREPGCVMGSSTEVDGIDGKSLALCAVCARALDRTHL
jgi:archaemetzincin